MNVLPFVRRYVEAKALWDALVGLYGAANGVAVAGGPVCRALGGEGGGEVKETTSSVVASGKGKEKEKEVVGDFERRNREG